MKRIFKIAFLVMGMVCCGQSLAASSNLQSLDNIVAIVNDTIITQTELSKAVHLAKSQMRGQNVALPPQNILRKQVLKHLINNKVQMEMADQYGIKIDELELDEVVKNIAKENGLTVSQFYSRIGQEGLTTEGYRKQIRESLTLQKLQQQAVAARVSISPDEINEFLHFKEQQVAGEKEYHIRDILIPLSDSPTPQEIEIAKKFSEDLYAKFQKGVYLDSLSAGETESIQDNDLSWRQLAEVPTAFAKVVVQMKQNDFYSPIQTSNGFHIIHLVGLRDLRKNFKKPDRNEVANLIFQRKFEESLQAWLAKLRSQAFIVIQDKAIA